MLFEEKAIDRNRKEKTYGRNTLCRMLVMWFINHIEISVVNRVLHKGDVHVYSRDDIQGLCDASGLKLALYEVKKGFRLHCVVRKPL